jgi:hypothetical protein
MAAEGHGLLFAQVIDHGRIKAHAALIEAGSIGTAQTMGAIAAGWRTIAAAIPGIEDGTTTDNTGK